MTHPSLWEVDGSYTVMHLGSSVSRVSQAARDNNSSLVIRLYQEHEMSKTVRNAVSWDEVAPAKVEIESLAADLADTNIRQLGSVHPQSASRGS